MNLLKVQEIIRLENEALKMDFEIQKKVETLQIVRKKEVKAHIVNEIFKLNNKIRKKLDEARGLR